MAQQKSSPVEPIAVVGLSCRFPGKADSPELYWDLLINKTDPLKANEEYPFSLPSESPPPPKGGTIQSDMFDASFFEISAKEAQQMDPQQRILLEVTWEALEDAGICKTSIKDSKTGVFIGAVNYCSDYAKELFSKETTTGVYSGPGSSHSVLAGRISYYLGLNGPSFSVDAACASSSVAIHLACQSLRQKECSQAIAGGVNLILSPSFAVSLDKMQLLSPDGICKPFDASANGIVRSDGCGVLVLKRLSDAIKDEDHIWAIIRSSSISHDGKTESLTAPNPKAQADVINEALFLANISPSNVCYIETHGTGTKVGDPLEVRSLTEVLNSSSREAPCLIGSVKANIGHCEAAAGVAGLIKVILSMHNNTIPGQVHFHKLNPLIKLKDNILQISEQNQPWPIPSGGKKIAGISSFGWSGTNTHILIEGPPQHTLKVPRNYNYFLLPLSAKSNYSLQELAKKYIGFLKKINSKNKDKLYNICFCSAVYRTHHPVRKAFIGVNAEDLINRISDWLSSENENSKPAEYFLESSTKSFDKDLKETLKIASSYEKGVEIIWTDVFKEKGVKTPLPRYPWDHKRYWIENNKIPNPEINDRTLLGEKIDSPIHTFKTTWTAHPEGILYDHVVYKSYIVPGAAHIAVIITALKKLFPSNITTLSDITFLSPLVLSTNEREEVQYVIDENTRQNPSSFSFFSRKEGERKWQKLSTGKYSVNNNLLSSDAKRVVPLVETTLSTEFSGTDFYKEASSAGLTLGPSFQFIKSIWFSPDNKEVMCKLTYPHNANSDENLIIPPGLIDSCFQGLLASFWGNLKNPTLYIPLHIDQFSQLGPIKGDLLCHAMQREGVCPESEIIIGDIDLYNTSHELVAVISGVHLKKALINNLLQTKKGPSTWIPQWEKIYTPIEKHDANERPAHWLVLSNCRQTGYTISTLLKERGKKVHCICYDFYTSEENHIYEDKIRTHLSSCQDAPEGIIFFPVNKNKKTISVLEREVSIAHTALYIVQELVHQHKQQTKLWLFTQGTQQTTPEDKSTSFSSSLWGMGRSINVELPAFFGGIIDLPLSLKAITSNEANSALNIILSTNLNKKEFALRKNNILSPSFLSINSVPSPDDIEPLLHPQKSYLISGAFGGLGMLLSRYLVKHGARSLIMCGRTLPKEKELLEIEQWKKDGVEVSLNQIDITDPVRTEQLILSQAKNPYPLGGVFHLAAYINDAAIITMDRKKIETVMAPKIEGAWNLHKATSGIKLDFFVMYSSISGIIGIPGQSNYAAANTFLDALASERKSNNLSGISIAWGAWNEVGMASRLSPEHQQSLFKRGIYLMNANDALEKITFALREKNQNIIIGTIEKDSLNAPHNKHPRTESPVSISNETTINKRNVSAPSINQKSMIENYIIREMKREIGEDIEITPQHSLRSLGVDSLMAVSLVQNIGEHFNKSFPITLFFDKDTLQEVIDYVEKNLSSMEPHHK